MGKNMDRPPVFSPAMADQVKPLSDVPWPSFNALWEAFVHLSPTVRWEQDPTSSAFTLHSRDLPPGLILRAVPLISALRLCIQTLHHLDAKLDFAADFCLPSPVASS